MQPMVPLTSLAARTRRIARCSVWRSAAVALLAGWMPAASAEAAQDECRTGINERTLAAQVASSGVAAALEYDGMRSRANWRLAREAQPGKVLLDPSSHLHALGSYHIARAALTTSCVDRRTRVRTAWASAGISLSVGLSKELADGFYNGFSATDLAVDAMGAGYAVAQAYLPVLEHIRPTFSKSPGALFQQGGARAAMVDYAQQTAWLSASMHDLLPKQAARYWPAPIRLSVGRRALGNGEPSEYAVGFDLDAARLPGTHPTWMRAKRALHYLRLPGPALVMTPTGAKMAVMYW
jgi:hypothetical protein